MKVVFVVRNWKEYFENAQGRKVRGALPWLRQPTKHDGRSYQRVARHENATALLGGWWAILQVAAKMRVHGLLADMDGPLDVADIAAKVSLPEVDIQASLDLVLSKEIHWMDSYEWDESKTFALNCSAIQVQWERTASTLGAKWEHAGSEVGAESEHAGSAVGADANHSIPEQSGPNGSALGAHSEHDGSAVGARSQDDTTTVGKKRREENRGEEKRGEEIPPAVPQGGREGGVFAFGDSPDIRLAVLRTCKLGTFKGKDPMRPWGYEAMAQLEHHLPVPESEWKLIEWFHSIPADPEVKALANRRQNETTLWTYWSDEVTRALAFRRRVAPNLEKKEVPLWREFFKWKYADSPNLFLPEQFIHLPNDQKEEYAREIEGFFQSRPDLRKESVITT